ncbi:lim domain-containing protein a-related [Anaeramoeba flamelloides]|uniref:Lim domain-containing protein a-related n=1 Tax=Anaeramoeba flamelloides TaxID=1746091 RepID=A0ABQ8XW34_9EUKA|nr:lim domain-containing protein a-related [Anaeramoeba flamelloides]
MSKRCPRCMKAVYFNERITALGRDWHKTCFKCTSCDKRLVSGSFTEHNNKPYCKTCYNKQFKSSGYGSGGLSSFTDQNEVREKTSMRKVNTGGKQKPWGSGGSYIRPSDSRGTGKTSNTQNTRSGFSNSRVKMNNTRKPTCTKCRQLINGLVIEVDGKTLHDYCFRCNKCNCELNNKTFFNEKNEYYCDRCIGSVRTTSVSIKSQSVPKCKKCFRPITGDIMAVDGNDYHEHCFKCQKCSTSLINKEFFKEGLYYYCGRCMDSLKPKTITSINTSNLPKCKKCYKPITGDIMNVDGNDYHEICFKCEKCNKMLKNVDFFKEGTKYYCNRCISLVKFQKKTSIRSTNLPKCTKCYKPITGDIMAVDGKNYHEYCFKCQTCQKMLKNVEFFKDGIYYYCARCLEKKQNPKTVTSVRTSNLPKCKKCSKPITGDIMAVDGWDYHERCFKCQTCNKMLKNIEFFKDGIYYYCARCLEKKQKPKTVTSVRTSNLPKCHKCFKPITGDIMAVDGWDYHERCFKCQTCNKMLKNIEFFKDGIYYYCARCLEKKQKPKNVTSVRTSNLPKCHKCFKPITGDIMAVDGWDYHERCFKCQDCNKMLKNIEFFKDGIYYYCGRCLEKKKPKKVTSVSSRNVPNCHKCYKPITSDIMNVDGWDYHEKCFKCEKCKKRLKNKQFFDHNGNYYCERCLEKVTQTRTVVQSGGSSRSGGSRFTTSVRSQPKRTVQKVRPRKEKTNYVFKF